MLINMDQVTSEKDVSFSVRAANIPIYIWYCTPHTFQSITFLKPSMESITGQVGQVRKPDIYNCK